MKILFVTPRIPYPLDTGAKIRTFNLLKSVSRSNDVCLLSFDFDGDANAQENLKKLGITIVPVKAKEGMKLLSIFSDTPVVIDKYYSRQMVDAIQNTVSINKFDLAHFDHLHMGQYRRYLDGMPCVLDEHNVESMMTERCSKMERNVVRKALFGLQAGKMANIESAMIQQFSRCLAVSGNDKDALMRISDGKARVEVVPNGVDTEYFKGQGSGVRGQGEKNAIVFTGSMDWLPNEDAVTYFCSDILPLVWKEKPRATFYIVGKNPSKNVKALMGRDNRIIVTGTVDDVRPYLQSSKVCVVPLRIGGGTRLKILEALAMEKAVVATSIGAEGLATRQGEHLLIADDPGDFARAVIRLIDDENLRTKLGSRGRELVIEKYDWKVVGKTLNDIYTQVVGG